MYDGSNVDQTGVMAKLFVYGPMIDEPVCMITALARYYYHADALGSVVALSDTSGSLAETYMNGVRFDILTLMGSDLSYMTKIFKKNKVDVG